MLVPCTHMCLKIAARLNGYNFSYPRLPSFIFNTVNQPTNTPNEAYSISIYGTNHNSIGATRIVLYFVNDFLEVLRLIPSYIRIYKYMSWADVNATPFADKSKPRHAYQCATPCAQ